MKKDGKTKGLIGKSDVILILILFLTACGIFAIHAVRSGSSESAVCRITVDGELYGTYDLSKDQVIEIGNTNVCRIQDGKAEMISADCPDQICVDSIAISRNGESIVCLPNRIVVTITGAEETADYDTIAS